MIRHELVCADTSLCIVQPPERLTFNRHQPRSPQNNLTNTCFTFLQSLRSTVSISSNQSSLYI